MEGIIGHETGAQCKQYADQQAQKELLTNPEVQPTAAFELCFV